MSPTRPTDPPSSRFVPTRWLYAWLYSDHELVARSRETRENPSTMRRGWDSNPRTPCGVSGFQDRRIRPLCHPSQANRDGPFVIVGHRADALRCQFHCHPVHGHPKSAAPIARAASRCIAGTTCEQVSSVTAIVECPSVSCTTFGCSPGASAMLA